MWTEVRCVRSQMCNNLVLTVVSGYHVNQVLSFLFVQW